MNHRFLLPAVLAVVALAGCSGHPDAGDAPAATEVGSTLPSRQVFHAQVAAFGQLAVDSRNLLSLSLPQAGQVVATEVVAGRHVRRGDVVLALATDPATRSAWLQAQNAVTVARDDLARTRRLRTEKLATDTQLDAARKALLDAEATLAAQSKLGGGDAVAALRAPADGVVTRLYVQRGQRIAAGTPLAEFMPTSALAAQLGIDPEAAVGVHPGMPVTIRPVYATHGSPPLHGTVALIGDAVNPQTRLVDAVATLDGQPRLAAGSALSATIDTSSFTAWAVPRDALQNDAQGDFLFQIVDGKARRVDVKVLAPAGSPVGVAGALDPRAPVVTLGSYEVSDGDPVHGTPAAGRQGAAAR